MDRKTSTPRPSRLAWGAFPLEIWERRLSMPRELDLSGVLREAPELPGIPSADRRAPPRHIRSQALRLLPIVLSCACLALGLACAVQASEPHTSPGRWTEPRMYHLGPPPAELANRVHLRVVDEPASAAADELEPRNPDTSAEGPWHASLTIPLENGRALELRLENVAGPINPGRVSDTLVFVRVPWGRIAFSDLLIETRHGELVFHELLLDGQIAFEQYQEALAHPDFAEDLNRLGAPRHPPSPVTPETSERP